MRKLPKYTLEELAEYSNSHFEGNGQCIIKGLNTLQRADNTQLSFLSNVAYKSHLAESQAACVILHPSQQHLFSGNKIISDDPYYTYALITQLFVTPCQNLHQIHRSVVLGEGVVIGEQVTIAPNVAIGNSVTIDEGVIIEANCSIGDNVRIGKNTHIFPNVSIYQDTTIGHDVIIHSQAVIGADGFGFAPKNEGGWQKIYQLGGVEIGNDVEVGAGTTIDRGALNNTFIANGVKLDNQIQIAHNVHIGEHTAIAGATAIAGSTVIGKRCTIAGAVGIIGHLTIADDVHITAMTLVTKSISQSGSYSSGTPMSNTKKWRKNAARFNRLGNLPSKK